MSTHNHIKDKTTIYVTASGKERTVINEQPVREIASAEVVSQRKIAISALEQAIIPRRYARNFDTFSAENQISLLSKRIVLIGLGGLGGYVLEHLLRAGVGVVIGCDGDDFDETNLNRQLLCTDDTLGKSKAEAAAERAARVNPQVEFTARHIEADHEVMHELFQGSDVVIDALGGPVYRKTLLEAAAKAQVPVVTAGVSGWFAWVSTVLPGQQGPGHFMGQNAANAEEEVAGTIVSTVNMAACLQSAEALKFLTGEASLAGKLLMANLNDMSFQVMNMG